MNLSEWAEREIDLACKKENPNWDGKSFDYGCSCYLSALKAYKVMLEDGHSGFSWGLTVDIFDRLANNMPLTPIEDTEDIWEETSILPDPAERSYQCKRMHSLFKDVHSDGTIKYHDVNRSYGIVDGENVTWHGSSSSKPIDELFPITMPYFPTVRHYEVRFHTNRDKHPYAIIEPDGTRHTVEFKDGKYILDPQN